MVMAKNIFMGNYFLGVIFLLIKPFVLSTISKFSKTEIDKIEKGFKYLSGLVNIIFSASITTYIKPKIEFYLNKPQVLITPIQLQGPNVSGIRKESIEYSPIVELGEKSLKYRVIYAKIMNVSQNNVMECMIEGKNIIQLLGPNEEKNIYIIVYVPNNNTEFDNTTYCLSYSVKDTKNNIYGGKYSLDLDLKELKAHLEINKKMKKITIKDGTWLKKK